MGSHHDPASALPAAASGDALSEVLHTVKLSAALFFITEASSPWGMEVPQASAFAPLILPRARHVISYHVVIEGAGWMRLGEQPPVRFGPGDTLVIPHGDAYTMLDAVGGAAPLGVPETLEFFRALAADTLPFVIEEGGGGAERARFVCGFLGCDARPFNPLLATLPRLLQVARKGDAEEDLLDRLVGFTLLEASRRRPGGQALRLRLAELMFIEVMRRHLESLPAARTGWLAGLRDPVVGRALTLLHQRPASSWTLHRLALEVGASRTALSERFAHLVGVPPMEYLARWRVQLAARLLSDGSAKVGAVAVEVGYGSEAAFSRAFKRIAGESPAAWRSRG